MIFSGFFEERTCPSCGDRRTRVTPTSLLFFVLLAVGGLAVLTEAHGALFEPRWWHWPAGFVAELILLLLLLTVLLWVRDTLLPLPGACPTCSEPMVTTTTGFYDFALLPTQSEVLLLVLFVGAHLAFLTWLSPGGGIANGSLWTLLPFFWTPPRHAQALLPQNW